MEIQIKSKFETNINGKMVAKIRKVAIFLNNNSAVAADGKVENATRVVRVKRNQLSKVKAEEAFKELTTSLRI